MPVRLPTSSASLSTEIASIPIGVGPCAWSVPTAIITVSDFLNASSASIQDISRSRNFFTLSASSWMGVPRGAVCAPLRLSPSRRGLPLISGAPGRDSPRGARDGRSEDRVRSAQPLIQVFLRKMRRPVNDCA